MKTTEPVDEDITAGIDLDPVIDAAKKYALGVFLDGDAADPDQTRLAAAILGGACQPNALGADDVGAVLSLGVTELLTAFGRGKAESTIGKFGK